MSKFDHLLDKDLKIKLSILTFLENSKGEYVSIDRMIEIFALSEFKMNNYINQLNDDFLSIDSQAKIDKENGKAIQIVHIDKQLIRQIRLFYSKNSLGCQLFEQTLIRGISIEAFCEEFFISRSKAYVLKRKMDEIFNESTIKNGNGQLQGSESSVRLLFFNYYYYFYAGMEIPEVEVTGEFVKKVTYALYSSYSFFNSPTKNSALEIFLSIICLRIGQYHYIEPPTNAVLTHLEKEIGKLQFVRTTLKNELTLTDLELEYELNFISIFLIAKEYIPTKNILNLSYLDESVEKLAIDMYLEIIQVLPFEKNVSAEKLSSKKEAALEQFYLLAFQIKHFRSDSMTFNSKHELTYFEEVYPQFDKAIRTCFDQHLLDDYYSSEEDWTSLYYDLMFLMISTIPQKMLDNRLYVCVDFSRGKNYTRFISESILAFKNLNIIVQNKITKQTDIFVSDFYVKQLHCRQIIWKNPPTDEDWAYLGDLFIQIKGEKADEQKKQTNL